MDQPDDLEEPFRIHLNLDNLPEEEAKSRFSLLYDERTKSMRKRENTRYLRPVFIDGSDVSNRLNHMIRKNMNLFPVDKSVFNVRAVSMALWHFISRGHAALVFLPTNLREFAKKCSDPHELCLLSKLELIVFDESTSPLHPSSALILSRTIATYALNNDGCIVGSRKKYALLGQKFPELLDRVTNALIRPSFSLEHELNVGDSVRMVLAADEVRRNEETASCMNFQMLASDQVIIMSKLARIIGKNAMIDLCSRAREINIVSAASRDLRKAPMLRRQSPSAHRVHSSPYHFNDPFLPEYVAPPPPNALETVKRPSRIGHKHSIYRVGGEKIAAIKEEGEMPAYRRNALINALEPMFGLEKATTLVTNNPEMTDINELVEIGIVE
ncbi:unnamed protein product [Caenorhabditis sp. 36 PRJEB53466]|nr:unnamed protein product [Caenorhabditis sp. 36 PRJEB53466]